MTLSACKKCWDNFFFAEQSVTPMAVYRILFGLIVLASTAMLVPYAADFFGPHAIVSADEAKLWANGPHINLFFLLPATTTNHNAILALLALSAITLTVGLCTRASALVVFLCLTTLHFRNPFIFHSGDNLMRLGAFILSFSHAGAALSVDSLLKGGRQDGKQAAPWAQRLLQLQLSLVYCDAFFTKFGQPQWLDGLAVWYAVRLSEFQRLAMPFLFASPLACKLLTWATLAIESLGFTLIWPRETRYATMLLLLALHMSFELTMNIPLFQWTMLATLVTFVYPDDMDRLLSRITGALSGRPPANPATAGDRRTSNDCCRDDAPERGND